MVDRRSAHSLCQMTAWGKSTEQHEAHRTRGCMRAQPLSYILLRQTWLALRNFIFTSLRKSNIAGARQRARTDLCLAQSITMTMVSNSCAYWSWRSAAGPLSSLRASAYHLRGRYGLRCAISSLLHLGRAILRAPARELELTCVWHNRSQWQW